MSEAGTNLVCVILSLCFYLSYGSIEEGTHCPTAGSERGHAGGRDRGVKKE